MRTLVESKGWPWFAPRPAAYALIEPIERGFERDGGGLISALAPAPSTQPS